MVAGRCRKVLKLNPKDREARFNLAKTYNDLAWEYYQQGKLEQARREWQRVLTINPSNKAANYNLRFMFSTRLYSSIAL